jgi:small subunit ribosomal protein S8
MSMPDPISDMLTRIRNGVMRRHSHVIVPASNLKVSIARIMEDEGYIKGFQVLDEQLAHSVIRIELKYSGEREPVISHLERISRPGRRVYAKRREVPWVLQGMGVAILSTSKGVMTDRQARRENVGGEVLCTIW